MAFPWFSTACGSQDGTDIAVRVHLLRQLLKQTTRWMAKWTETRRSLASNLLIPVAGQYRTPYRHSFWSLVNESKGFPRLPPTPAHFISHLIDRCPGNEYALIA